MVIATGSIRLRVRWPRQRQKLFPVFLPIAAFAPSFHADQRQWFRTCPGRTPAPELEFLFPDRGPLSSLHCPFSAAVLERSNFRSGDECSLSFPEERGRW